MNIHQIAIPIMILGLSSNVESAPNLESTWLSNAERTIQSIESTRELSDEERAVYRRMFGHLKFVFEANTVVVDQGMPAPTETKFEEPYTVIATGSNFIVVDIGTEATGIEQIKYVFESDCIKATIKAMLPDKKVFEYFCRVE